MKSVRQAAGAITGLLALVVVLLVGGCDLNDANVDDLALGGPAELAQLAVTVGAGDERSVIYGDRAGTFFYDALTRPQQDRAMGFIVGDFRMMDGWRWWIPADSVGLGPREVEVATVRPDFFVRSFTQVDTSGFLERTIRRFRGPGLRAIREVVTLGEGTMVITVPDSVGVVDLFPAVSDRSSDGYTVEAAGGALLIARSNYMEARQDSPRPVWLAVVSENGRPQTGRVDLTSRFPDAQGDRDRSVGAGRMRLETPASVAFATGMTQEEAIDAARRALDGRDAALERRQAWITEVLESWTVQTEDEEFNRSLAWSRIMLEQLVRQIDGGIDLRAGVPGAEGQPGWNTMQAMEGAFLATGQWERAADMLRLYARNQRFDRRLDIFGRAPTRFDSQSRPIFETADAAAVLVGSLGDYLRTTGNERLVLGERRLFWTNPVFAQRGFDDRQQLRTRAGLIRNNERETWVQATAARGGEARAPESVEVQARYIDNLRTMAELARIMGVRRQADGYRDSVAVFQRRFERAFVHDDRIADFRDGEGNTPDVARPSALFALRSFDLGEERERRILRNLAEQLVYEHGVSTRPQGDERFYPFLNAPDFYEPEMARYEGTVWTALSGPLISLLVDHGAPGLAQQQFATLNGHVLHRGAIGAIPENLDAHPHSQGGAIRVGGAPVQPWSLAEYLRVIHQDLVGVRYLSGQQVILEPHLPESWGITSTVFRIGGGSVRATITRNRSELQVELEPQGQLPRDAVVHVRGFGQERQVPVTVRGQDGGTFPAAATTVSITSNRVMQDGEEVPASATFNTEGPDFWADFEWKQPEIPDEYSVMQRLEEERRLTAEQIMRDNPVATVIVARTDPVGDDWGTTATYTYPTGYPPRIMDATYLEIAEDSDAFYFRIEMAALAGPEEFGHQPTFFALAINTEEGGQEQVGRNANFSFPRGRGYNYIVFIGDGIRVEDHRGRVLGEFPELAEGVVDPEAARVQFSLPKFVLESLPRGTQLTLLVGANDGSRSPGRFRTVAPTASAQYGGGKVNPRDPNIYDIIAARVER